MAIIWNDWIAQNLLDGNVVFEVVWGYVCDKDDKALL